MKAEDRKPVTPAATPPAAPEVPDTSVSSALTDAKDRLKSMSGFLVNGLLVVALGVVLVLLYNVFAGWGAGENSSRWLQLDMADERVLGELITRDGDTLPGKIARVYEARSLFGPRGLNNLSSQTPTTRQNAIDSIEKARDIYEKLVSELADEPVLRYEAAINAARAEETLIGIPKKDKPSEFRGDLAKAQSLYEQAAKFRDALRKSAPKTAAELETLADLDKVALDPAAKAKELKENADSIKAFYTQLNDFLAKKERAEIPAAPVIPGASGVTPGGEIPGFGPLIIPDATKDAPKTDTKMAPPLVIPPETKDAPKGEPKAEPKTITPMPKAEPKSEPKAEPKVEPKVEPKAEPKVEPKVEPKAEPKAAEKK